MGYIGISNTVARVVLGALSQKVSLDCLYCLVFNCTVQLNRLFLYNTCLVVCGLTMALSNYFQPVAALMVV